MATVIPPCSASDICKKAPGSWKVSLPMRAARAQRVRGWKSRTSIARTAPSSASTGKEAATSKGALVSMHAAPGP